MRAIPIILLIMCGVQAYAAEPRDYPVTPVPFTAVHFTDGFWTPRLEANRKVTVPYDFKKCEETGRIDNFLRAAHKKPGKYQGYAFNDSDVFKVVEGAAYSLALQPDADLDRYLDGLIAKFAGAQEADGYLYAARTTDPNDVQKMCGKTRYSNLQSSHELYNIGHMYEAAAAHFAATGKHNFLDIAIKSADHVDGEFGPGKRVDPPGHEEIEMGLVKLYRATGDERYLKLAKFLLDCRGRNLDKRPPYGDYAQDHIPVTEQDHAVGHSVRAGYLYSGMADVAALTGDEAYVRAIDRIWENMVNKRLYITGGIGARSGGEAFGDDYELPNREAYAETCAAIANALWNQRMFLLHGDAKYIDVLERVLYNGFLSGVSLGGDRFFYVNPLASDGKPQRKEWFDCSCCPTNVVRFIPSIPGYAYAQRGDGIYVNLFVAGTAKVKLGEQAVEFVQETKYPWDGDVKIRVNPARAGEFTLFVRIPGWATGKPVPGDLYTYMDAKPGEAGLEINGTAARLEIERGYAKIRRAWQAGDTVELRLPMPVRRVVAHPQVKDNVGRVAIERGPILYCVEAVDNGGKVRDLVLPDDATLLPRAEAKLLGGVTVLHGSARRVDESGKAAPAEVVAVPYYAWCHRAPGEMAVWLARTPEALEKPALPASASHTYENDTVAALSDGRVPKNSGDLSIPRFTWWDRKGTTEWVQYDFPQPRTLHRAEVYWFDDTGLGQCRVPASWRLLYKVGEEWRPLQTKDAFGTAKDQFNAVTFEPMESAGLRIEVKLQDDSSGGILEWKVE
jgi:uncharacterized protein